MNEKLVFSTIIYPTKPSEANTILLASSIRARAGALAQARIWCYSPSYGQEISTIAKRKLHELNVELIPFDIDRDVLRFFFTAGITAASLSESRARDEVELLAWVDSNTIILQEPRDLLLQGDRCLGFRPVHHTLVGSRYDEPLDPFWTLVYRCCNVPEDHVFPMTAHVDGERIRPYFNAGLLIVRPEKGLLRAWYDRFFQVYQSPEFQVFYERDQRYVIFAHQAILSGVLLSALAPDEMQELPPTYNYPLHLYEEDVTDCRPARLEDMVTCRHEELAGALEVIGRIPGEESLKHWLSDQARLHTQE